MKFLTPIRIGGPLGVGVPSTVEAVVVAAAAGAEAERERPGSERRDERRRAPHRSDARPHGGRIGAGGQRRRQGEVKDAALAGRLETQMRPPCWSTIRSQTARPMPVPG